MRLFVLFFCLGTCTGVSKQNQRLNGNNVDSTIRGNNNSILIKQNDSGVNSVNITIEGDSTHLDIQ